MSPEKKLNNKKKNKSKRVALKVRREQGLEVLKELKSQLKEKEFQLITSSLAHESEIKMFSKLKTNFQMESEKFSVIKEDLERFKIVMKPRIIRRLEEIKEKLCLQISKNKDLTELKNNFLTNSKIKLESLEHSISEKEIELKELTEHFLAIFQALSANYSLINYPSIKVRDKIQSGIELGLNEMNYA